MSVSDVRRVLGAQLRPVWARLRGVVRRGTVTNADDSGLRRLRLRTTADDGADDVESFEPYGLTAAPVSGAEAITLAVGGDPGHLATIVVSDRRYRLTGLAGGEVAIYNDKGAHVLLKADGSIELTPALLGKVHVGGPSAVSKIALNPEVVAQFSAYYGFWASFAPTGAWAADAVTIKAGIAALASSLVASMPGSNNGEA